MRCEAVAPTYSQSKLLVPPRIQCVRLDRGGPDELGGQRAPQAVPLLPHPAVLPLEAQLEAVVLAQLLAPGAVLLAAASAPGAAPRAVDDALEVGGVGEGAVRGEGLGRGGRRRHRLDAQHAVGVAETFEGWRVRNQMHWDVDSSV